MQADRSPPQRTINVAVAVAASVAAAALQLSACGHDFAVGRCDRGYTPPPASPSARPRARQPRSAQHAQYAPPLPRRDLARLRYALAVARAALARWPWAVAAAADSCVQIYAEHAQWLLRCEGHAPASFRRTGQRFDGQPIYANVVPVTFYGQTIPYKKIAVPLVASVGWYQPQIPGSAMYRGRPWFVIQALDALVENHPAFGSATRTEAWLAVFVHELFHLPQLAQPAVRRFLAAHGAAWRKNPGNRLKKLFAERPAYAAAIRASFAPLAAAVARRGALDARTARAVLRRWLAAHRARQQRFARALAWPELALWEDFELYVEGLARHVENSFVVDAARHPGAKAALAGDPRYHAFAGLEGKLYVYPKYGRMRAQTWFYEMGAHLARLLDRAVGSAWHQTVANHPGFLVAEVQRATRRSR